MSEGRNNTPSWVGPLMGALLTAGTVWATIRQEVPQMVQEAVHAEVQASMATMMAHQDSAWSMAQVALHQRVEAEAGAVRDSMLATLHLIAERPPGRVVYSPNITVAPDTIGTTAMLAKMDSIMQAHATIIRELSLLRDQAKAKAGARNTIWKR